MLTAGTEIDPAAQPEIALSDVIVAPETRDLDELAAILAEWLTAKLSGARYLRVINLDYPRGAGQSHETILFDAEWQDDAGAQRMGAVVRIKPGRFTVYPDDLFDEQYRVMRAFHENGWVKVAEPLWLETDEAVLGRPFFVMRKITGRVPVSIPPYANHGWVHDSTPAQRHKMWEAGVRELAKIQTVPLDGLGFLGGPPHARDGFAQEWDKYTRFVTWLEAEGAAPEVLRVLERGFARLDACRPANQPAGLVWGDARLGNMMFGPDYQVVAVMDWEQPSLGGALHDLAWFVESCDTMHGQNSRYGPPLEGMGSPAETVALWEEVSGKSAVDLDWYIDFTTLKKACLGTRMGLLRGEPMGSPADLAVRLKVN